MKTKYLYVGNNIFLIKKFKIALPGIDIVVDRDPISALKHLNKDLSIEAVLFESTEDKTTVSEFVNLFHEEGNRDIKIKCWRLSGKTI
jgi:hypothetical protein